MRNVLISFAFVLIFAGSIATATYVAHLIPHSHDDPGWLNTVNEYYEWNVSRIIPGVVDSLLQDSTKRFNWAETVFFKKWWEQQTEATKESVRKLANNKQLEFVGGGWVQNDEAVADYVSVIDQMTEGHQYLFQELAVKPQVGWQIDPFGASGVTAVLFQRMGFKYHVIDRIDDRLKTVFRIIPDSGSMAKEKALEFYWKPSAAYSSNTDAPIFTHVLDTLYVPPFSCSYHDPITNETVCSGFDFEGDPTTNPPITEQNIADRAALLVSIIKERAQLYRTSNLLLPFGSDFTFQNASLPFDNMDKLIKYINDRTVEFNVTIRYSTLSEYFDAVTTDANTDTEELQTDQSASKTFPEKIGGDFFPYASCWGTDLATFNNCIAYWSGFYSSYPGFKGLVRQCSAVLRNADILFSLTRSDAHRLNSAFHLATGHDSDFDWMKPALKIQRLRRAISLAQHHDAITGTSKIAVREDYTNRLIEARDGALEVISEMIGLLMTFTKHPQVQPKMALISANVGIGTSESESSDQLNSSDVFSMKNKTAHAIVLYNSLGWLRREVVCIRTDSVDVEVHDSLEHTIPFQIIPESLLDKTHERLFRVCFACAVPALGYETYFLSSNKTSSKHQSEGSNSGEQSSDSVAPNSHVFYPTRDFCLENEVLVANFSGSDGFFSLKSITNKRTGAVTHITQKLMQYKSWSDGAYIFRTDQNADTLPTNSPAAVVIKGIYVQEYTQVLSEKAKQTFRLYSCHDRCPQRSTEVNDDDDNNSDDSSALLDVDQLGYLEIVHSVAADDNQEIISQFTVSNMNTESTFYTDNGIEMMQRHFTAVRFGDKSTAGSICGNYYPMISTAFIRNESNSDVSRQLQLTVLSGQSMGVSSQQNGSLEFMLIRRTSTDDGRGVVEALNDTSTVHITQWLMASSRYRAERVRHSLQLKQQYPLLAFSVDTTPIIESDPRTINPKLLIKYWPRFFSSLFVPLSEQFPRNLHLLTLSPMLPAILSNQSQITEADSQLMTVLRLQHLFEKDASSEFSSRTVINLHRVFGQYALRNAIEQTLSTLHNISTTTMDYIALEPLQMRTFSLELQRVTVSYWAAVIGSLLAIASIILVGGISLAAVVIYFVHKRALNNNNYSQLS